MQQKCNLRTLQVEVIKCFVDKYTMTLENWITFSLPSQNLFMKYRFKNSALRDYLCEGQWHHSVVSIELERNEVLTWVLHLNKMVGYVIVLSSQAYYSSLRGLLIAKWDNIVKISVYQLEAERKVYHLNIGQT